MYGYKKTVLVLGEPVAICVTCASKHKLALGEVVEVITCIRVVS